MLEIRKKGNKNFWHYYNGLEFSGSDIRIAFVNNNVTITRENGAFVFLREGFDFINISVYDDTASGIEETFATVQELEQRLIDLGYIAFYEDGNVDLSLYALKSNVLQLNNTTPFTPDADYKPATKKYVDDNSSGASTLVDLTDTNIDTPTNAQALVYDTATGKWINGDVSGGVGTNPFIKVGGGNALPTDNKYTGGNNGFGGQETPAHPIDVNGILRKRGKGQANGLQFDTQTLHSLGINGLSHLTVQEVNDGGTRFYLIPKGNTTTADQLASGIKMFSTDYEADAANYHDFGIWVTQNELIFNSKKNGTFPKQLPFVWKFQDSNKIMKLQPKANAALMLGVPDADEKNWTIFNPLQLGGSTCLLGRAGVAASEWINNAYYDGTWKKILAGESQRFSLDTNGDFVFWTDIDGAANAAVNWVKRITIKNNGAFKFHPLSAAPSNPEAGDTYFDSTLNKHRGYDGTTWNNMY
jgi:hypothetical protein